jgi:DNA polymerase-1
VIGTLAKHRSHEEGSIVMVVTPDKDMAQLVNDSVGLLRPLRGEAAIEVPFDYLSAEGVYEKFGVNPNQIASWLALIGDVSDNIPGVPGVGPKTATKLLEKYGDLMTVMTHADSVAGKLGESLRESRAHIETSHKLTTIQTDLPMDDWVNKRGVFDQSKRDRWAELALFPHWMGHYEFNATVSSDLPLCDVQENSPF